MFFEAIRMNLIAGAVFLLSLRCVVAKYGSSCLTPENKSGICLPVKSCISAYLSIKNLLELNPNEYDATVERLRNAQCDGGNSEPHICCARNEVQINPDIYEHLSRLDCGKGYKSKISHGERAGLFEYRWSVLLKYEGSSKFLCAGSLITEQYVLTAAHCVLTSYGKPQAVRLGEYDLTTDIDCVQAGKHVRCSEPFEDVDIEQIIPHPDSYHRSYKNDIALVRLVRPVQFKKNIVPICLPISKELQTRDRERYVIAGWGRTEHSSSSNVLLYTTVPQRDREVCHKLFRFAPSQILTENQICAGGERLHDSCKGDSGGALFDTDIYTDGVARSIQRGIVSFGVSSCGELTAPAIYTNVSNYMQWITDHIILN